MKRVLLICTTKIGKTGITNVVMNYLRSFNTVEIKFDLCAINNPEQTYIDIVRNQGGNVYVIERLGKTVRYFKKLSRLSSLLKLLGLENRICSGDADVEKIVDILSAPIDYDAIDKILEKERNKSLECLRYSIER